MKPSKRAIIALFLAVPILWGIAWFLLSVFITDTAQRGQFGDMFGAVNALFSGWAFVGVIVAILLQREELELQREELKETRKEFQQQNETLKRQRFENTFFSMLSLHNEILDSLYAGNERGRRAFVNLYSDLERKDKKEDASQYVNRISKYLVSAQSRTGHYFRSIYRIFVFIDQSSIADKDLYAKIVRAQLSDHELMVLFCNCYFYQRGYKFRTYAERYDLFDNLPNKDNWEKLRDSVNEVKDHN